MTKLPASQPLRPARLIPLAVLPALLACSPLAHAVDGTITINGEITDSTCKINGKDAPADLLVHLPKISTSAIKNKGDVAGATVFTLKLTDCPSTLTGKVQAHFEPGLTTDYDSGNLYAYTSSDTKTSPANAIPTSLTKANNVEIQLANADGSAITIGAPPSSGGGVTLMNGSGDKKTATLHYMARYYRSSAEAITAGKLVSYVQYSIIYP
ncbi:fimbrial protein [Bordetella trematum]|uniref:fimbrial protein n=1 Tax=Bordetella trematum TaxID=123899 RepID=UPI0015C522FB|nr:fimbrial protein [Bordetella trematum]